MLATYMLTSGFVANFPYDEVSKQFVAMPYVQIFDFLSFAFIAIVPSLRFENYNDKNGMYWLRLCRFCLISKCLFVIAAILKYPRYGEFFALTLFIVMVCHLYALSMTAITKSISRSWFNGY